MPPVGRLPEPIDFSKLVGQAEYRAVLARAHSAAAAKAGGGGNGGSSGAAAAAGSADAGRLLGGGEWLTPAEIFRPWYGAAVAHYVLEAHALEHHRRRQQQQQVGGASGGVSRREEQQQQQQQAPRTATGNRKLTPTMLHEERQPPPGDGARATAAATANNNSAADAATTTTTTTPTTTPLPPLYIVEIGGGTGALALSILDHIRDHGPQGLYDRTTYVCVEVSSPLAAAQRSAVAVEGGHARAFVSVVGDATERETWDVVARAVPGMGVVVARNGGGGGLEAAGGAAAAAAAAATTLAAGSPAPAPTPPPPRVFVLAMEVLDNLPHDRVERAAPGQPWLQTAVAPKPPRALARRPSSSSRGGWSPGAGAKSSKEDDDDQQQQWRQVLQPVADPLVARCARVVLPLLAAAGGGDARAPAVLAGIEEKEEEEAAVPPSPSPSPTPTTTATTTKGWGWDPASWLRRLLAAATGEQLDPVCVWLPTRALALADALHAALPSRHTLVASDFDALPGVQVEGHGAPIVSGRRVVDLDGSESEEEEEEEEQRGGSGEKRRQRQRLRRRLVARDHAGVLVPWGTADIFFPTDFDALSALYVEAATAAAAAIGEEEEEGSQRGAGAARADGRRAKSQAACQHMPTADFMAAFAESKRTRTLSGYNPLLQDFRNTRFFIGAAR